MAGDIGMFMFVSGLSKQSNPVIHDSDPDQVARRRWCLTDLIQMICLPGCTLDLETIENSGIPGIWQGNIICGKWLSILKLLNGVKMGEFPLYLLVS